jgi:hypothetical protein
VDESTARGPKAEVATENQVCEGSMDLVVCLPVAAGQAIPAGKHQVRMEFAYDGDGLAKGANVTLYYDDQKVGEGRVERTVPMIFSADETTEPGSAGSKDEQGLQ